MGTKRPFSSEEKQHWQNRVSTVPVQGVHPMQLQWQLRLSPPTPERLSSVLVSTKRTYNIFKHYTAEHRKEEIYRQRPRKLGD